MSARRTPRAKTPAPETQASRESLGAPEVSAAHAMLSAAADELRRSLDALTRRRRGLDRLSSEQPTQRDENSDETVIHEGPDTDRTAALADAGRRAADRLEAAIKAHVRALGALLDRDAQLRRRFLEDAAAGPSVLDLAAAREEIACRLGRLARSKAS